MLTEQATFTRIVTTKDELRALYGEPTERAAKKDVGRIDRHCAAIISRSPFMLLGTAGAEGRCDVSPKGDVPGFVHVLDEHTLLIPDRPGNRRTDSLKNLIENPHVGLLFMVPREEETLRVNGRARIVLDDWALDRLAVEGKRPVAVIAVEVEEAYVHCAKAFKRSHLWEPEQWAEKPADAPSYGAILKDHAKLECSVEELDQAIQESLKKLY